jgi:Zn-dependent protease
MLGVFNLIPVHPLDGFKVVRGLIPNSLIFQWDQMRQYGVFILLILIFSGAIRLVVIPILALLSSILGLV